MGSAYIIPTNLKSKDRNSVIVCQKTYEYITTAKWGQRYEPYFHFGMLDGDIWVVAKQEGFGLFPDWRDGNSFLTWFQKKIQSLIVRDKNASYPPLDIDFAFDCPTVLPSFGLTVGEVYKVYLDISNANVYRARTIEEDDLLPLPDVNAPRTEPQPTDEPAEGEGTAPANDNTEIGPNEVRIVFDETQGKLRAKGNDGEHGELWVRFPTDLRIEGAHYRVGGLDYAEGSNGNGFYKVRGFIQRIDIEESLTEALLAFEKVVADAYDHFTGGLGRIPTVSELLDDIAENYEGYESILDTEESARKWHSALAQELNRQGLETTIEEDFINEDNASKSRYDVEFEFTYPGEEESESYFYYVPEGIVIEAVRRWFSDHEVEIDGTDNHVWNICGDLAEVFNRDDQTYNDLMYQAIEDQADWIREQCKEAAWDEFVEDWQERHEEDESLKEAKGVTTYSYKGSYWDPPEWEGVVISDISGEEIESEDDTWITADGDVGTEEEVREVFMETEVTILKPDTEEYEEAKKYMMENFEYGEEDFEKAELVKLSDDTYDDMATWDLTEIMGNFDYHQIDWDSSAIDWDPDERDYDDWGD